MSAAGFRHLLLGRQSCSAATSMRWLGSTVSALSATELNVPHSVKSRVLFPGSCLAGCRRSREPAHLGPGEDCGDAHRGPGALEGGQRKEVGHFRVQLLLHSGTEG